MRAIGRLDRIDAVAEGLGFGRYRLSLPVVETNGELAASRLFLVVDVKPGSVGAHVVLLARADPRPGSSLSPRLHATVAVPSPAILPAHHLPNLPAVGIGCLADAAVLVGDEALGREDEPVPRVPKARLKVLSNRRCDEVGGDARVAIVSYARDRALVSPRRLLERSVERSHAEPGRVLDPRRNTRVFCRVDANAVFGFGRVLDPRSRTQIGCDGFAHRLG